MRIKWKEDYSAKTQRSFGVLIGMPAGFMAGFNFPDNFDAGKILFIIFSALAFFYVVFSRFCFFSLEKNPGIEISYVKDFTKSHDNMDFAVVRVSAHAIRNKGSNTGGSKVVFKRRQWVKIKNNENNKCIYRKALGSPLLKYREIELDYDSRLDLSDGSPAYGKKYSYTVSPLGSCFEYFLAHWKHPIEFYKAPLRVAVIGIFLSLLGVILSFK
nr:hypothetical protein [Alcaligenes faecalis]